MINIYEYINKKINEILKNIGVLKYNEINISFCKNIILGHYQINGLYYILKKYNLDIDLTINIIKNEIKKINFIEKINIVSEFINIFIKKEWIENELNKIIISNKFNFTYSISNKKIIIDYSSPNLAKEMHVGHLRSTIIGDSISRILEFLGNKVIRINHVGDWGINFGMLISEIINLKIDKNIINNNITIKEIEKIYKISKKKYKKSKIFFNKSQNLLSKLQDKNDYHNNIWKKIINLSINNNQKIYNILNIKLKKNNILGESFYIKYIEDLINDLINKKIAINKNKLILIPIDNVKNRYGKEMNLIIRKSNNTYLYSTIEIVSMKYRCMNLKPDVIIYCIDKRQFNHLNQSLLICKKAKYIPNNIFIHFCLFGIILDKENKPLKTREGNALKLIDLINKSILVTKNFLLKKNKKFSLSKINKLSNIIGISSLKYFDLSKNRNKNYVFNIENIISVKKNTAIYIYYTYVRILSILKKYGIKNLSKLKYLDKGNFCIDNDEEMKLSLYIMRFEYIIFSISKSYMINILCSYLYEISTIFSKIYVKKNILSIKNKNNKICKLNLCILTAKILKISLNMLGIKTIESI